MITTLWEALFIEENYLNKNKTETMWLHRGKKHLTKPETPFIWLNFYLQIIHYPMIHMIKN